MKFSIVAVSSLVLFSMAQLAYSKNYYFSATTGNDTYSSVQAQSSSTPWKSLTKLNSFFGSISPGDSILFKRGDTFNGNIVVSKSGSSASPIIFAAYGTGANPVISGFATLSGWSLVSSGVYGSACSSCKVAVNMVTVNGVEKPIGRYPNTGYLTFTSHAATPSITDNQLSATPNWTGAEVVIRKNHWIIDRDKITNQSGGTISYTSSSFYTDVDNNGFFIQNDPRTLDQSGEWYYKSSNKNLQMYFGGTTPSSLSVKASAIDTLVTITNKSYITFTGLSFQGANIFAFYLGAASNISILNCNIDLSGVDAILGQNWGSSSDRLRIENSTINHTNNNAIYLGSEFTNASIQNNLIKNTALIPGMGLSGDATYECININGNNSVIQQNELDSAGYSAIIFYGSNISVKNNLVNSYCLLKDDGGGIYTYRNSLTDPTQAGSQINGNIVLNGTGNVDGLSNGVAQAEGIYTDGYSSGVTVINNTVANCANAGMFINSNTGGSVSNNLFYNNKIQIYINQYFATGSPFANLSINQNILFCKQGSQLALSYSSNFSNIDPTLSMDNNHYVRPLDDNIVSTANYTSGGSTLWNAYNLSGWQTAYNKDKNSQKSPVSILPYTVISLVGSSKYAYGTFEGRTDLPYISTYAASGSMAASYDNTSKIDGIGSMKISYSGTSTNNTANLGITVGALSSAKNYILRFSTLGATKSRVIGLYLQQIGAPYTILTPIQYITIPPTKNNNEVLFSYPATAANAGITMQLNNQDGALWVDDIQFYEANVTLANPDSYVWFGYNATGSNKTFSLTNTYVDVYNKAYSGSITLKPYTSLILMTNGPGQGKIQQNPAKQTGAKPAVY